ncbi:restriction endonuclease subunit S [Methylophaga sp.]|uniref:restriction endonuclease subunit S n=1 Tax=Methylophaga sp. TaxID=2024840 RepID=UPI003F6F93CD
MGQVFYQLPDGWAWHKLADVIEKTENLNPSKDADKLWIYIDISSVDRNRLTITAPKKILGKEVPSRAKKHIQKNDVIFATTRPNLKNIALVREEYRSPVASTGFCVLRANEKVLPTYLFYYVTTDFVQGQIEPFVGGASYPAITDGNLKKALIPLPSIEEQKRIVEKLDALLTRIDTAIKHLQSKLTLSKQLFNSVLDEFFKLADCDAVPLTEVVDFIGGSQPPKSQFSDGQHNGYVRLIQIRDYKSDNHIVYIDSTSTKKFCTKDDVMIGRYGPPVFQILRGLDGAYNVALMKAVPNEEVLTRNYLFWFLQSPSIQNYVISISQRAAGQSGVNKKALEKYLIPIPSKKVQNSIVERIDQLVNKSRELEFEVTAEIESLSQLKASILDSAFKDEL